MNSGCGTGMSILGGRTRGTLHLRINRVSFKKLYVFLIQAPEHPCMTIESTVTVPPFPFKTRSGVIKKTRG